MSYNIENYFNLLTAIINQDNKDDSQSQRKTLVCLYDTKNYDVLYGVFCNMSEMSRFFGRDEAYGRGALCRGNLFKARYRIEIIGIIEDL